MDVKRGEYIIQYCVEVFVSFGPVASKEVWMYSAVICESDYILRTSSDEGGVDIK